MKLWLHKHSDSKRLKILKNCASLIHSELLNYAKQPIDKNPYHERELASIISKLNSRIKRAEGQRAKEFQLDMDFQKQKRKRIIRKKKLSIKVATSI